MTDHMKTLRELVAAGEKATPGPWWPDEEGDVTASCRAFTGPDGAEYHEVPVASCGLGHCTRDEVDEDRDADFNAAAANARPDIAKLLKIVEAAQTVANMVSKGSIRPDTYIHEKETQEFAWNALEDLDAALRNLEEDTK